MSPDLELALRRLAGAYVRLAAIAAGLDTQLQIVEAQLGDAIISTIKADRAARGIVHEQAQFNRDGEPA